MTVILGHLILAWETSFSNVPVPTLLTCSEVVWRGMIIMYEAQIWNWIENGYFWSHFHSRQLFLSDNTTADINIFWYKNLFETLKTVYFLTLNFKLHNFPGESLNLKRANQQYTTLYKTDGILYNFVQNWWNSLTRVPHRTQYQQYITLYKTDGTLSHVSNLEHNINSTQLCTKLMELSPTCPT